MENIKKNKILKFHKKPFSRFFLTQKCFSSQHEREYDFLIAWVFPFFRSTAELISEISAVQFFNLNRVKKIIRP